MNEQLPDPLVPADVDLRDFGYMPLDALRLRDSELAIEASPEVFRASVLLWCASWHQVPAGSLPSKDKTLAEYSRAGSRWARIRAEVLSKWTACSDGRLYHPVVAEKAREAQAAKDAQRARTKAASEAKAAKARAAHPPTDDPPRGNRDGHRHGDRDDHRYGHRNDLQGKGREGKGTEGITPSVGAGKPASTPKPKPAKRCPPEFVVTVDMVGWAKEHAAGVDVPRETVKFRNHEFTRGKSDWLATWRNWMLEAADRLPRHAGRNLAQSFRERDAANAAAEVSAWTGGRGLSAARPHADEPTLPEEPHHARLEHG